MRKKPYYCYYLFVFIMLQSSLSISQNSSLNKKDPMMSITGKGVPAPVQNFTGKVYVNIIVADEDHVNTIIGKVTFEKNTRTHWHQHPAGQTLIVTEGMGYYQEKGQAIRIIKKGDVVKIMPDIIHWHGGSHHSSMEHIAIVATGPSRNTIWQQPVSDQEYNAIEVMNKTPLAKEIIHPSVEYQLAFWPDYLSNAKETDPELISLFNHFAIEEVLHNNTMDIKTSVLIVMASTIASQAVTEYKLFVHAALNIGITPVEIKEVLYQSVPYTGISKVIDFIYATNEIFTERNIPFPIESQAVTNKENRLEKGLELQKYIFGSQVDSMYKNSPKDLVHIQEYLSANVFGDYISRSGLNIQTREMITLAFLIAMGGTESQIKAHIQGNANVGNTRKTLINLITQLVPYLGYPRTLNAINCLNQILPE